MKLTKILILLLISIPSIFFLAACQQKVKEPIITIDDTTSQKENLRRTELGQNGNNTIFKQIFLGKADGKSFYNKQIETNDTSINKDLVNKKLKIANLPDKHYAFLTGISNKTKPSYLLGRIEQQNDKVIQWKQEIKYVKKMGTKDVYQYEIKIPAFEGEQAKISFRYIWLNDDNKCYSVADQLFILKKIKSGNPLEDRQ